MVASKNHRRRQAGHLHRYIFYIPRRRFYIIAITMLARYSFPRAVNAGTVSAASLFAYKRIAIFLFLLFARVISAVAAISLVHAYVQKCGQDTEVSRVRVGHRAIHLAQTHFCNSQYQTCASVRLEIISVVYAFIMRTCLCIYFSCPFTFCE